MKNDFVHATTGMPFPHKAHTRADYLAASPALISKHGRPTCQPVGGRPAAASGGSKEKAAVSPSQLTVRAVCPNFDRKQSPPPCHRARARARARPARQAQSH
mmetsp:Transcript_87086/g.247112  ORF Transcript_87086/g.247112 Transcript_87086/m.247112 type:complete len:102 (+) Transcript_87086:120-425(+)